jgi:hypothetical protein
MAVTPIGLNRALKGGGEQFETAAIGSNGLMPNFTTFRGPFIHRLQTCGYG